MRFCPLLTVGRTVLQKVQSSQLRSRYAGLGPANPILAVAPEPEPVPATRQKPGDLNPLPASDVAAPSFSSQKPTND